MGMKCLEISVETDPESAEAVSALFNQYGQGGAVVEQIGDCATGATVLRVKTYLLPQQSELRSQIEQALWHLAQIYPMPAPSVRWLSEADWAEQWKADYGVLHIGRHWVIKPSWQPYSAAPGEVVIELNPGMAFGTGLHPSTRLCLMALEDSLQPGDRVLDAGTGTGILAIGAAKLGAADVLAVDVEPIALEVAKENSVRNGVTACVSLRQASLASESTLAASSSQFQSLSVPSFNATGNWNEAFDLLLMNILAKVVVESAPTMAACLRFGARFVVSGIIAAQEDWVRQSLQEAGLHVTDHLAQDDWVALLGRKESRHGLSRDA